MSDLEDNYLDLKKTITDKIKQRDVLIEEMKELERSSPDVRKYKELIGKELRLRVETTDTFKLIRYKEFDECNHILVKTMICTGKRNRPYTYCGCIKCGLTDAVESKSKDNLNISETVMYDYLEEIKKRGYILNGNILNIKCDLSLAKAIYSKIDEIYPYLDESLKIKYFARALAHIRQKNVSDERKISRAKRLSLESDFNSWYSSSIDK